MAPLAGVTLSCIAFDAPSLLLRTLPAMSEEDPPLRGPDAETLIDHSYVTGLLTSLAQTRDPVVAQSIRAKLYQHCAAELTRFCQNKGPEIWDRFNPADALDVVHEAFVNLEKREVQYHPTRVSKGSKGKQPAKGYTYLCQIVKNALIDRARAVNSRMPEQVSMDALGSVSVEFLSQALADEIHRACSSDGASEIDVRDAFEYADHCYRKAYEAITNPLQKIIVHQYYVERQKIAQIAREVQAQGLKASRNKITSLLNEFAGRLPQEVETLLCQKPKTKRPAANRQKQTPRKAAKRKKDKDR